jgi:hypothetical protein
VGGFVVRGWRDGMGVVAYGALYVSMVVVGAVLIVQWLRAK